MGDAVFNSVKTALNFFLFLFGTKVKKICVQSTLSAFLLV